MIVLHESKMDTLIRISIILVCVIAVSIAFFIQGKNQQPKESMPLVSVIHESNQIDDPPLLAVYQSKNSKHYLILYEVIRTDNNRFKATNTIELSEKPKMFRKDKKSKGVWVNFDDRWTYYNENLENEKRDNTFIDEKITSVPFQYETSEKRVNLFLMDQSIQFSLTEDEKLIDIYTLSKDKKLLLAHFENDIKIIVRK